MRYLISSAVFGLVPVPLDATTSGDECGTRRFVDNDVPRSQSERLSPDNTERMATKAELARVRRELGINVGDRSKPRGARYKILGRGWGAQCIRLLLNHEDAADAKARELAAMLGQSPVAVIDTDGDRRVTFYFADGRVCSVLRKPAR